MQIKKHILLLSEDAVISNEVLALELHKKINHHLGLRLDYINLEDQLLSLSIDQNTMIHEETVNDAEVAPILQQDLWDNVGDFPDKLDTKNKVLDTSDQK